MSDADIRKVRERIVREHMQAENDLDFDAALGAGMSSLTGFPREAADRAYPGRTLFLGGGQSDYILPEHHPSIYRLFPNAEFEEIPDAGHWVHAEAPASFLAHVQDFLARTNDEV